MKSRALSSALLLLFLAGSARSQGTSTAAAPSSKASRQRSTAAAAQPQTQAVALADFAIQSPAAGSSIRTPSVNVRVRARDDISSVFVNGIAASREPDGGFVAVSVPLPEGPVVLTATGRDAQGRTRRSSVSVVADRTPPRLVVSDAGTPLESGAVRGRPVHPVLTVTDSSPVTVKATLNGKPFVTGSAVAQTGHYTLEVEAADRAGNVTRRSISFRIDTRAPRLARLEPASGAIVSGDAISIAGEADHASAVTVAGTPALLYGGRFIAARVALALGSNSIEIVARDSAGNEARSTLKILRDDSPPRLIVSSPKPGTLTREAALMVRGTALDEHLSEILVNSAAARLLPLPPGEGRGEGRTFEREVRLNEGPNRVVIVARDSAGNRAETYLDIIRDSTAPSVSIRTPGRGTVAAGPTIDVEGDCLDANLASVAINGIAAAIEGGRFRATRVPLSPGENTITATALDRAGNAARASVSITRDDRALAVKLDLPETGALRSNPLDLSGKLDQGSGVKLTVNGATADVSPDGQFRVPGLRLNEGLNTLTLRATDASGRTAVRTSVVTLDTVPLVLSSIEPADGANRVASAAVVHVTFGKPIDPATANASTVRLVADVSGEPVSASLFVNGKDVALLPHAALADRTAYRVEVSDGVADLAGNRLRRPQSVRFETGSVAPPSTPELDAVPAAVCATSLALSGRTDPAARVRVLGAASPLAETVAGPDGRFSLTLRLPPETMSSLTIVASDAQDRSSRPVVLPVRTDCTAPRVESARLTGNNIEIVFSEPIDRASFARDGAVLLTRSPGGVVPTPRFQLDSEGRIARSEPLSGLPDGITTLTVSNLVTDLAGNPLPAPYVTRLASSSGRLAKETGDAGLSGQVFDDRIGRPLSGAVVTVVAVDGAPPVAPPPSTTTDGDGAFALVVPAGEVALRAAREGYTAVVRVGTAAASESITVFDFRLTPETVVAAAADGSASVADKELTLALPASSVAGGSTMRGASLSPQGLPLLAPLGWSPAAALSLEVGPVTAAPASVTTLPAPAAASWTSRFGYPAGTSLLLAHYDADGRRFLATGSATLSADAATITASIPSTGVWAVFVADPAPYAPPQPSSGQPLAGVTAPSTDPILSASVTSDPQDVLPTQTADITGVLALSAPLPSGYPVEVLVSETLTLVDSSQISAPSFLEDLTVLRDGTGRTIVPFRVRPSATAAQVALSVGYENLLVKRYSFDLRRGDLVGSGGGTVVGPSGLSVVIPPNALTQTVPVTLTPASAAELPVPVPAGYQFLAAVRLAVGGQELASPAALRWASDTDPTGNGLIWVEIADYHGVTRPRFAGPGRYDATNKFVETTPASVHNLPVSGVTHGGLFALLKAAQPIAWVKGRVLDVDASAVAAAVVSEDGTSVVAVTDGLGAWALPIGTAGGTVRSIRTDTGNVGQATVAAQSAGATATQDISLVVTAPYVVSVAPAAASVIPLDLPIVFRLSEPLNPSTVNNSSVSAVAGGNAVAATVRLSSSGTQLTVTPTLSWPGKSSLTLTLSSTVTDRQGYRLVDRVTHAVSSFVVAYTTVDPTPPTDINPLLIGMGLPTGVPSTVTIAGSAGAACPGCTVIAVNDTTTVTSSTTALSDGSFSMTLAAKTTDSVYLIVRRSGGGEIRISPGPFRDDGGRVAYLGPRAADYITRDGIRVTLDEGSFSLPVTLKVKPIAQTALPAPMPTQSTFIAAIAFDPGDAVSSRPIDLSVAAPPGVTGGQFLVARAVQVLGETKWMVIDTARYDNGAITTRPAPGSGNQAPGVRGLLLASGPNCPELQHPGGSKDILDRVTRKSNLLLLGVQQQLSFVAAEIISPNALVTVGFSAGYEALANFLPYVWVAKEARQQCYFAMAVPLNVPFSVLGRDATSGLEIFHADLPPVTDPNNVTITPTELFGTSIPAPRLVGGDPFTIYTFVPAQTASAAPADRRALLPKVNYSFVVSGGFGSLTIYGDPGAATGCVGDAPAACTRFTALSAINNLIVDASVTAAALADGSFQLGPLQAIVGQDITVAIGTTALSSDAQLELSFSQFMSVVAVKKATLRDEDSGASLSYGVIEAPGSHVFTLVPSLAFRPGHTISLTVPAGDIPKAVTVKMTSPGLGLLGSRDVKDVNALFLKGGLLLEVTGDAGNVTSPGAKLNLYDASDPAKVSDATRCDSKDLNEFARGVTMDDHDRVIVALGGGGTNGRVQVFRLTPYTGAGPCGGRRLSSDGTGPQDLDRAYTEVTIRTGAGDLGVLPEGFPRALQLLTRETVTAYVVDRDTNPLPTIISAITKTPDPNGNQLPNSPVGFAGRIGETAWNQPVSISNKTTGAAWTSYVQNDGSFNITAIASSRDLLEIRVNGSEVSIVGTLSFGIQAVDVNRTLHFYGQALPPLSQRLLFSFGRIGDLITPLCLVNDPITGQCAEAQRQLDRLNDLVLLPPPQVTAAGELPAPAEPAEVTVLAAMSRFGLATFSLTGDGQNVQINQLGPGVPVYNPSASPESQTYPIFSNVVAARGFPVKASDKRLYCSAALWKDNLGGSYSPTLAFLASTEGVFVLDVTKASVGGGSGIYPEPYTIGLFRLPSSSDSAGASLSGNATSLSLDASRGLLYVGSNDPGTISVYDMTDPCTSLTSPALANDPRRIASVDLPNQNPNTAFVVDHDTGIVFGAGDSPSGNGKAFALSLFAPSLKLLSSTKHDGTWEEATAVVALGNPNSKKPAAPYPADVVRILAGIFGGAGPEIVVEVDSTTSSGSLLGPMPSRFPRTKTYVALKRQSDDPADPGYNRYLSPPVVLIADPRARKDYQIKDAEREETSDQASKAFACRNCKVDTAYDAELSEFAADGDGKTRSAPARKAVEQWAGDRLVVRLAEDSAAETALKAAASYLSSVDLKQVRADVKLTRGDWAPALRQAPALNASTGGGTVPSVYLHSGEVALSATDFVVKGRGFDFSLSRFYSSQAIGFGPLGSNWDSPLFARLRVLADGSADYFDGTGRRDTFQFVKDSSTEGHYDAPKGVFLSLYRRSDGVFLLRDAAGNSLWFEADGRLWKISDRYTTAEDESTGNIVHYDYDGARNLVAVRDTLAHRIEFAYYDVTATPGVDGAYPALLKSVTDHTNRQVIYRYDSEGRLLEARLPELTNNGPEAALSGDARRKWQYTYATAGSGLRKSLREMDNIIAVTDPRGNDVLTFQAHDLASEGVADTVDSFTWGGKALSVAYDFGARTATVTDRRGKTWKFEHDDAGRATTITQLDLSLSWTKNYDGEGRLIESRRTLRDGEAYDYSTSQSDRHRQNLLTGRARLQVDGGGPIGNPETFDYYFESGTLKQSRDLADKPTTYTRVEQTGQLKNVQEPPTVGQSGNQDVNRGYDEDPATGQLNSETDPVGMQTTYSYFPASEPAYGYLKDVTRTGTDSLTQRTVYERDARGNVTAVIDPRGVRTEFLVNEADQVVEEHKATTGSSDGAPALTIVRKFGYDADGNLKTLVRPQAPYGNLTDRTTYDLLSRPTVIDTALDTSLKLTESRSYDENGNLTLAVSPAGRLSNKRWDSANRLTREWMTGATGDVLVKSYALDGDGNVTSVSDELNTTTTVTQFDKLLRPTTIAAADGTTTELTYSDRDEVSSRGERSSIGVVLHSTAYQYSDHGELTVEAENWGAGTANLVTTTYYGALGLPLVRTGPLSHNAGWAYDGLGRVSSVVDAGNSSVDTVYDAAGNPTRVTEREQTGTVNETFVTAQTFDALGRLVTARDAGGHTNTLAYDESGNLISSKDALFNETRMTYDGAGRKLSELGPEGRNRYFTYEADGLLKTFKDGNGNTTTYGYDEAGRRTQLTYPDTTSTESWTYNSDGTVSTHTDANGTAQALTYDAKDRVTRVAVTKAAGVGGASYEAYAYDGLDRVTRTETDSATGGGTAEVVVTRAYGNGGGLSSETVGGRTLARTLDDLGRATSLQIPGGAAVGRTLDALDRVTGLMLGSASVATLAYRGPSRIDTVTRATGVATTATYDSDRRLSNVATVKSGSPLFSFGGTYDERHLIKSEDRGGTGDAFAYDNAGRLTQAGLAQSNPAGGVSLTGEKFTTTLDPADNWTGRTKLFGTTSSTVSLAPNNRNQYPSFGTAQTFDTQGNLKTAGAGTYTYDFKNRLIRAALTSGTTLTFVYDADGRMLKKTTVIGTTTKVDETLYEGWEPIARFVDGTLAEEDVSLGGPDSLVAYRKRNPDGPLFHLHTDLRGNTVALTDGAGALAEKYRYTPYGEVLATDGAGNPVSSTQTLRLFQGLQFDPQLGFYYARNRWLDPVEGRWISQDPLGLSAGQNLYAFVGGTPTANSDPMGLYDPASVGHAIRHFFLDLKKANHAMQMNGPTVGGPVGIAFDYYDAARTATRDTALDVLSGLLASPFEIGTKTGTAIGEGKSGLEIGAAAAGDIGETILTAVGVAALTEKAGAKALKIAGDRLFGDLGQAGMAGFEEGAAEGIAELRPTFRNPARGDQSAFAGSSEEIVSEATGVPRNIRGRSAQSFPGNGQVGSRFPDLKFRGQYGSVRARGSVVEVKAAGEGSFGNLSSASRAQLLDDLLFVQRLRAKASLVRNPALQEILSNAHVELFTDLAAPTRGVFAGFVQRGLLRVRSIPR